MNISCDIECEHSVESLFLIHLQYFRIKDQAISIATIMVSPLILC